MSCLVILQPFFSDHLSAAGCELGGVMDGGKLHGNRSYSLDCCRNELIVCRNFQSLVIREDGM